MLELHIPLCGCLYLFSAAIGRVGEQAAWRGSVYYCMCVSMRVLRSGMWGLRRDTSGLSIEFGVWCFPIKSSLSFSPLVAMYIIQVQD